MKNDATLADVLLGDRATLGAPRLDAPRARRLAELGLRSGATVAVLHRTAGGGRVLGVDESRIAVDRTTLRALALADPSVSGSEREPQA